MNPIQNTEEILGIPAGLEPLGMDANVGSLLLAQQIERKMA